MSPETIKRVEPAKDAGLFLSYTTPDGVVMEYPDPYEKLIKKIESSEIKEKIDPKKSLVFNVDLFQDAFRIGGLPLLNGNKVLEKVKKSDDETKWGLRVDSIDLHSDDNIGNAIAHGLPAFSTLELSGGDDNVIVKWADGSGAHTMRYEEAKEYCLENKLVEKDPQIFSADDTKEYLERQRDFRAFVAVLLDQGELSDLGQMLWPLHANKDEAELGYLKKDTYKNPGLAILKGGKIDGSKGRNTDSYAAFMASDGSIVKVTDQNGYGTNPTEKSSGRALNELVEGRDIENIVVRGLAFTHCNKFTVENLRTMQEIWKLDTREKEEGTKSIKDLFVERLTAMKDKLAKLGVNDLASTSEKMFDMYKGYTEAGLMLDPSIKISIHVGHSDPVRLPNVPEEVQSGFLEASVADYQKMGVDIISDKNFVN